MLAFFHFDLFPVFFHLAVVLYLGFSEDVRMALDKFVAQPVDYIGDIKGLFFLGYFGIKNHMQQQVTQLLSDFRHVVFNNGVGQFVSLLDRQVP